MRNRGLLVTALVLAAGALAGGRTLGAQEPPPPDDLPPAGFGTLRQDDASIALATGALEIQVLPLDERVIRLLAPDTYTSLHRLVEARRPAIDSVATRFGIRTPTLFLVTFFGREPQARFEPEILAVTSQGRLFRPIEILPLSPLWNGRILEQRETATAVYLFEDGIRILDPLTVAYGALTNQTWERILRVLDRERTSVLARAARRRP